MTSSQTSARRTIASTVRKIQGPYFRRMHCTLSKDPVGPNPTLSRGRKIWEKTVRRVVADLRAPVDADPGNHRQTKKAVSEMRKKLGRVSAALRRVS
jgi:hypothetical protein